MKKKIIKNLEVVDYTHEGYGIAKVDRRPVFIKGAVKGETVDCIITQSKHNFDFAEVFSVSKKSENRVEASCEHYEECGGCHVMHMSYEEQLSFKTNVVKNLIYKSGLKVDVEDCVGSNEEFFYRNKVIMPVRMISGEIVAGFFKSRSHDLVPIRKCYIQNEELNKIMRATVNVLNDVGETAYDEDTHKGNIRGIYLRIGVNSNEIMVTIISYLGKIKQEKIVVEKLTRKYNNIKSVVLNVNNRHTNAVLGYKNLNLYNKNSIADKIGDYEFKLSTNSFFQVNPYQMEQLYNAAIEKIKLTGSETLLDAFCGSGTIGIISAKHAGHVIGVDNVPSAIKDAKHNAEKNNIDNIEFICNDIESVFLGESDKKFDAMIIDPPRKGIENRFMKFIRETKPEKIVYISCNPSTLVRDLKILSDIYEINTLSPFDMFPQTYHVEVVTSLTLK